MSVAELLAAGESETLDMPSVKAASPFSWSAAIAGTLAAIAVTFLVITLGSGIGLSFASPYGAGPSVTVLTIAAAVWLLLAQALGFAAGGYLAARLRRPVSDARRDETTFRDAAEGFVVWALGVVVMAAVVASLGLFAAGAVTQAAAGAATGNGSRNSAGGGATAADPVAYFVDLMFRPNSTTAVGQAAGPTQPQTTGSAASDTQPLSPEMRSEMTRILARATTQGRLDEADRAYLAQVVSARAGLQPDEAERRVSEVEMRATAAVKDAADKAAKATAMFSFWTFMSLLFGGTAATLAGILGGQLRDAEGG